MCESGRVVGVLGETETVDNVYIFLHKVLSKAGGILGRTPTTIPHASSAMEHVGALFPPLSDQAPTHFPVNRQADQPTHIFNILVSFFSVSLTYLPASFTFTPLPSTVKKNP